MSARTFASFMFLLLAFTGLLLVFAAPGKQERQEKACPAGTGTSNNDEQTRTADGNIIWESVSRHLLGAVQ